MNINYLSISLHCRTKQLAAIIISSLVITSIATASIDLKRGDPAPTMHLIAIDGTEIDTSKLKGSTLLVLFCDAAQPKSQAAFPLVNEALNSTKLNDQKINWLLILSKHSDPEKLSFDWSNSKRKPIVLHDVQRQAFGAYRAVVTPSAAIVDKQGKIVHTLAGFTPDFGDTILDALLVSAGKMTPQHFDKNLKGDAEEKIDENHLRAERISHLADRLSQRSLTNLAEAKYREALDLVPDLQFARLGLAEILLSQNKISEAQGLFQGVLDERPDSQKALLGLARISLKLEPPDIAYAQLLVERVLKHNKSSARGHYMLGTIHELRGNSPSAAASYKLAAELLLKRLPSVEEAAVADGSG